MRYLLVALISLCPLYFSGCGKRGAVADLPKVTLEVFAAASLTESFTDIGRKFEASNPDVSVEFNFAGSQQLLAEIESGAKADVFASANEKEMTAAGAQSLVKGDSIHDFAGNRLVIILPQNNPARISVVRDLSNPGVKIDVADVSVPVGKYTQAMLDQMKDDPAFGPNFTKGFLANVVSREDSVKAVLAKVRLGEADAGVVYVTDVTTDAAKDVMTMDVPERFNQLARYPIAVIAGSLHPDVAGKFEDFVLSNEGQAVLRGFNFLPPPADGH